MMIERMAKLITTEELFDLHNRLPEGAVLLDVRTPAEYQAGHVPGAMHCDHEAVLDVVENLRSQQAVYVYCRTGPRAVYATAQLESVGLSNLICLARGGFMDWSQKGYPVEK
jgi:rhodanese-related sulfurtransferase